MELPFVTPRSQAERLEHAVAQLMAGDQPVADRAMAPLLEAAELVRAAMPPIPVGDALDARLLAQITQRRRANAAVDALEAFARRELQHPGRLIAAGAVSSAAVGAVTAVAVWRMRRHGGLSLRAGQR
jgi:hypothetical protein